MTLLTKWWPYLQNDPTHKVMALLTKWWPYLQNDDPTHKMMALLTKRWPYLQNDNPTHNVRTLLTKWWPYSQSDDPTYKMTTLLTKWWPYIPNTKNLKINSITCRNETSWGVLQNVTMTPHWTLWLSAKSSRRTGAHVTSLRSLYIQINME